MGSQALTIRAVARQVGAPPMSLYSHFSNKDELLDLMYSQIVQHLYRDSGNATWQAEMLAVCRQLFSTLVEHPQWTQLLARRSAPMEVPVRERLLAMMVADGIPAKSAFMALSSCVLSASGLVLMQQALRNANGQSSLSGRYEALRKWTEEVPGNVVTREAVASLPDFDISAIFEHTIAALVRGFEVRESPSTA
jgi:AcrR family transcriptional regulator